MNASDSWNSFASDSVYRRHAHVEVENEGPLLPEGMRERLFDSMVSVRAQSGGETPHLGLGLYIVRLVAEFHGGGARAENRTDGKGVVVTITLPLAVDR